VDSLFAVGYGFDWPILWGRGRGGSTGCMGVLDIKVLSETIAAGVSKRPGGCVGWLKAERSAERGGSE